MKKILSIACLCTAFLFNGCGDNNPLDSIFDGILGNITEFTGGLLQGQGLNAYSGLLPEGSVDVLDLEMNGTIISGGSLMFKVESDKKLNKLYIQIKGVNDYEEEGYYELDASEFLESGTSNPWIYNVTVEVSQEMNNNGEDLIIKVSALTSDGDKTKPKEETVETIEVESGALQISLTWNNYDDLDLWVLPPNGNSENRNHWIYYANDVVGNGYLDLDALGCSGHEQNENIFFSELEDGEYTVVVELYEKCSSSKPGASYNVSTFSNGSSFKISDNYQGKFEDSDSDGKRRTIGTITVKNGVVVR